MIRRVPLSYRNGVSAGKGRVRGKSLFTWTVKVSPGGDVVDLPPYRKEYPALRVVCGDVSIEYGQLLRGVSPPEERRLMLERAPIVRGGFARQRSLDGERREEVEREQEENREQNPVDRRQERLDRRREHRQLFQEALHPAGEFGRALEEGKRRIPLLRFFAPPALAFRSKAAGDVAE